MNKEQIKKSICDELPAGISGANIAYELNPDKLAQFLENIDFQLLTLQKVMKEKFGEIKEKFETGYTTPDSGHITETTYTQKPKEEVNCYEFIKDTPDGYTRKRNKKTGEVIKCPMDFKEEVKYYRCISNSYATFIKGRIYKEISQGLLDENRNVGLVADEDFQEIKKPKEGGKYWFVDSAGEVSWSKCGYDYDIEDFRWKSGNFYWAREEAQEIVNEVNSRDL